MIYSNCIIPSLTSNRSRFRLVLPNAFSDPPFVGPKEIYIYISYLTGDHISVQTEKGFKFKYTGPQLPNSNCDFIFIINASIKLCQHVRFIDPTYEPPLDFRCWCQLCGHSGLLAFGSVPLLGCLAICPHHTNGLKNSYSQPTESVYELMSESKSYAEQIVMRIVKICEFHPIFPNLLHIPNICHTRIRNPTQIFNVQRNTN